MVRLPQRGFGLRLMDKFVQRGFSQTFYRERLHEKHYGYPDLESFMVGFWEGWATSKGTYNPNANPGRPLSVPRADLSRS